MIRRMSIFRALAASGLLAIGALAATTPACIRQHEGESGATCMKDDDCDNHHCVQTVCMDIIVDPYCDGGPCKDNGSDAPAVVDSADETSDSAAESATDTGASDVADGG